VEKNRRAADDQNSRKEEKRKKFLQTLDFSKGKKINCTLLASGGAF